MKILVTGAAGFLGRRLLTELLAGRTAVPAVSRVIAADLAPCPIDDPRVESRVGDITDAGFISAIVDRDVRVIWHLAAVLSGQSEAEFDAGLRVNVDATRALLDRARSLDTPARFVFSSTIAALGAPLPDVVPEDQVLRPKSSYGAAKVIAETLVSEYSRRGFVDGIACRVPTVAIRPGKPNSALSSFVSGIVREPLAGIDAVCPVPLDTRVWITSPRIATANLAHAATVPAIGPGGPARGEPAGTVCDAGARCSTASNGSAAQPPGNACGSRSTRTRRASSARGPARSMSAARWRSAFTPRATSTRSSPSSWRSRELRAEVQFATGAATPAPAPSVRAT